MRFIIEDPADIIQRYHARGEFFAIKELELIGDGMVTRFANGLQMVLQREGWRGSCGVRFEGSEGWVAVADGYSKLMFHHPP